MKKIDDDTLRAQTETASTIWALVSIMKEAGILTPDLVAKLREKRLEYMDIFSSTAKYLLAMMNGDMISTEDADKIKQSVTLGCDILDGDTTLDNPEIEAFFSMIDEAIDPRTK